MAFGFLILALSYNINITSKIEDGIFFFLNILFICCMYITAGIDKEKFIIPNGLIIYGLIIGILRVIGNYMFNISIIPNLLGFCAIPLLILVINVICKRVIKIDNTPFGEGDIKYLAILGLYFGFGAEVIGILISILTVLIGRIINYIKKNPQKEIAFGYYLSIGFMILLLILPHISSVIEICNLMIS